MPRQYYPLWYRLDLQEGFLLWYANDADGVWVDHAGRVLAFSDVAAVNAFTKRASLSISEEPPVLHDLDAVASWIDSPTVSGLDPSELLCAWNLFTDVAASTNQEFEPANATGVYEKLFWANNLPAVTPPGEKFTPEWRAGELTLLASVLKEGLKMFRHAVKRTTT